MTRLTERDIRRNMRALAHAVAQQVLEGLKVPAASVADLHRVACGEIETDEVTCDIYLRLQNVPLLRQ